MRGLNTHLVPLLKKIQRDCAGVQHILDAGCGSGLVSFAVKLADPAPEIVATDRSRAMSALVQEKNQTFAGLKNRKLAQQKQQQQKQQSSPASPSAASAAAAADSSSSTDAPLVQFVIGDLSASPERFVILPTGTNPAEVAVGGRKQFDTILCIDVLAFLPSMEAMKRALFNLVLHAKPHAKLLLSVPNLSSCAEDAAKLTSAATLNTGAAAAAAGVSSDPQLRPKVQRSLHFKYDRHSLSLGCSVHLSHGGVLDVVERQWYDILTTTSHVGNIKANSLRRGKTDPGDEDDEDDGSQDGGDDTKSSGTGPKSNLTRDDGLRKVLRRHTEWFGFSCPNPQHSNSNAGGVAGVGGAGGNESSPQIFYEQMEELILHPTVLECMFNDMGWHVEEVWLFNALERGGEVAAPTVNTMAVLGAVPGSESPGRHAPGSGNTSDQPSLESQFSHRLYRLTRK
jgi:SAM-dependent methyltransferase